MTELFLDATVRTDHGKNPLRRLRQGGKVPAVIYGLHEPVSIQLDTAQALRLVQQLHGAERLVALRFAEGPDGKAGERQALMKEVQTTPVGNTLLHIDFQEIDTEKKVHVTVEIRPVGTSEGVRLGGILQAVKHDIVVECLPNSIPEFIEIEVSALEIGDSLHVRDIKFGADITPITDPEETIIVISAPRVETEEEVAPEEEEGVEGEGIAEEEAAADAEKPAPEAE